VDIFVSSYYKWGIICGEFKVVENSELLRNLPAMFFKSLEWVENTLCFENESPFLKISSGA